MAAAASDDVKPADAFCAAASMIPLRPIAASAILQSYDYNGDDRIFVERQMIAPEAINAAASEAVNQLEDVTKKASEALMLCTCLSRLTLGQWLRHRPGASIEPPGQRR